MKVQDNILVSEKKSSKKCEIVTQVITASKIKNFDVMLAEVNQLKSDHQAMRNDIDELSAEVDHLQEINRELSIALVRGDDINQNILEHGDQLGDDDRVVSLSEVNVIDEYTDDEIDEQYHVADDEHDNDVA